jgi:methylisocitrate lyase
VDADTGYGNPLNVHRTVAQLIAAGDAGCFLEDQIWPKRCGHLRGKRMIGRDDYVQKVRAAVAARAGRDFFIVARTDALAIEGLNEAIARVSAARAAGADARFVEAPPRSTSGGRSAAGRRRRMWPT